MKKTIITTLAAIAIASVALTGCSGKKLEEKSSLPPAAQAEKDAAATAKPTATPKPAPLPALGTLANPGAIGAAINGTDYTGATYTLTFGALTDNANQIVADTNQFNDVAGPGTHYVILNATITNTSTDATASVRPGTAVYDLTLTDSTGKSYDQKSTVLDNGMSGANEIYAGQTATGDMAFLVLDGATGLVAGSGGVFVKVQ